MAGTKRAAAFEATVVLADGSLRRASYMYSREDNGNWRIERDGELLLTLGSCYELLRCVLCGMCGTDFALHRMPFPLPQIAGHEVVARREDGSLVAIDINDGHVSHGSADSCPFCERGLPSQCPYRMTLGIDRLPGGAARYVLAPINNIVPVPVSVSAETAVFAEPFAASLQALRVRSPRGRVGVLGVGRLGALLMTALIASRNKGSPFTVDALVRHTSQHEMALRLGVDSVVSSAEVPQGTYDMVFEATGSPEGLATALLASKRIVHIKSTTGQRTLGLANLTAFVVDELALASFSLPRVQFQWENVAVAPLRSKDIISVWVSPHAHVSHVDCWPQNVRIVTAPLRDLQGENSGTIFGVFDVAIIGSLGEFDDVVRPPHWSSNGKSPQGVVRARGIILLAPQRPDQEAESSALSRALLERDIELYSSRCGDIGEALSVFEKQPELCSSVIRRLNPHRIPIDKVSEAWATKGVWSKVILDCL